jgi:hypothetical protein
MKNCFFLFFLFTITILHFSCKKTEITPAYLLINVDDININVSNFNKEHETDYDKETLDIIKQQNFKDVLVSLNGRELGYWQLPCKIPLLPNYSNINHVRIVPCVRIPNTTLTTVPYYFLSPFEKPLSIEKEGEYRFSNIEFEYVKSISFPVLETFSQTTIFKPRDSSLYVTPMEIFIENGKSMGRIALKDSLAYFDVISPYFELFGKGIRQYWEMNYKCENGEIYTYIDFQNPIAILPQQDMIILPATNNAWKKIYIDITDVVSWACGSGDKINIRLGIRGVRHSNDTHANFYFENIKLISMYAPY